jgi:NADPH:quinone reductase-like Zn-dependent oxidoreductase
VGHVSVQLARALGGMVWATASEGDQEFVSHLGATPMDYRKQTVEQYVESSTQGEGFDFVVDTVGGETLDACFVAVKHFGQVVSALGWGTHALAPLSFREATYSGVFTLNPLLTSTAHITGDSARSNATGRNPSAHAEDRPSPVRSVFGRTRLRGAQGRHCVRKNRRRPELDHQLHKAMTSTRRSAAAASNPEGII